MGLDGGRELHSADWGSLLPSLLWVSGLDQMQGLQVLRSSVYSVIFCSAKVAHPAFGLVLPLAGRGSSWSGVTIGRAQASLALQMGFTAFFVSEENTKLDVSRSTILGKKETIDNGIKARN